MKLGRLIAAIWVCVCVTAATAQTEKPAAPAADKPAASTPADAPPVEAAPDGEPGDAETVDAAAVEADIAAQELSGEAKVRLDAARDAVVQIRGFFDQSESSAFHGSGFAVEDGRRIVTNYHVVAQAVLYPRQYRLEYLASDGRTGPLARPRHRRAQRPRHRRGRRPRAAGR